MTEKIHENEGRAAAPEAPAEASPSTDVDGAVPAVEAGEAAALASPAPEHDQLKDDLVAAIKTVFDPEIPVDIYELGLIYRLDVDDARNIEVDMTLTAPGCPVAGDMPGWVHNAISAVPGVGVVKVNLVFDPPWDPSRMSDEARFALNMF